MINKSPLIPPCFIDLLTVLYFSSMITSALLRLLAVLKLKKGGKNHEKVDLNFSSGAFFWTPCTWLRI